MQAGIAPEDEFVGPDSVIILFSGRRAKTWCYEVYADVRARYGLTEKFQFPTVRQLAQHLKLEPEYITRKLGLRK